MVDRGPKYLSQKSGGGVVTAPPTPSPMPMYLQGQQNIWNAKSIH